MQEYCEVGKTPLDKIGNISAALLVLSKLNSYVNKRADILDKVSVILAKLLEFSRSSELYRDLICCLTITLIQTFISDIGGGCNDEQAIDNLKGLFGFLFEVLNDQKSNISVSFLDHF